jgi:hypothetical protein
LIGGSGLVYSRQKPADVRMRANDREPGSEAMKKWTRPVFEGFDVNGEATAYAGAMRDDTPPRGAGVVDDRSARREAVATEPAPGTDRTASPCRGAV